MTDPIPVDSGRLPTDLPEVRPPSSSFFVQLFLIPAFIVFGIMIVWFLFSQLAAHGTVEELVDQLASGRKDRWKAAMDLAQLLQHDSAHTKSEVIAQKLADELVKSIDEKEDHQLSEYLCGALGSFHLPTAAPPLRRALQGSEQRLVRRSALISLGRLGDRLGGLADAEIPPAVAIELQADDAELRSLAAMTLGLIGHPAGLAPLQNQRDDPEFAVRCNGATALAKLGDASAMSTYAAMIDPVGLREAFVLTNEANEKFVDEQLVSVTVVQGLKSLQRLAKLTPTPDFAAVLPAVQKLASDPNAAYRTEAKAVLVALGSP